MVSRCVTVMFLFQEAAQVLELELQESAASSYENRDENDPPPLLTPPSSSSKLDHPKR